MECSHFAEEAPAAQKGRKDLFTVTCKWCGISETNEDDVTFKHGGWYHITSCLEEYEDARADEAVEAMAKEGMSG